MHGRMDNPETQCLRPLGGGIKIEFVIINHAKIVYTVEFVLNIPPPEMPPPLDPPHNPHQISNYMQQIDCTLNVDNIILLHMCVVHLWRII